MTSISSSDSPVCASSFLIAGAGAKPIIRGSTPTVVEATIRARGLRLNSLMACSDATKKAAAPSLMPEALPAVTVPFSLTTARSLVNFSSVVSARGCSSLSTMMGSPLRCGIMTGVISSLKNPDACAAWVRCWLRSAKASWSARLMLNCSATFSAVCGMVSVPYNSSSFGLIKRQPMVVSFNFWLRPNA